MKCGLDAMPLFLLDDLLRTIPWDDNTVLLQKSMYWVTQERCQDKLQKIISNRNMACFYELNSLFDKVTASHFASDIHECNNLEFGIFRSLILEFLPLCVKAKGKWIIS